MFAVAFVSLPSVSFVCQYLLSRDRNTHNIIISSKRTFAIWNALMTKKNFRTKKIKEMVSSIFSKSFKCHASYSNYIDVCVCVVCSFLSLAYSVCPGEKRAIGWVLCTRWHLMWKPDHFAAVWLCAMIKASKRTMHRQKAKKTENRRKKT